MLSLLLVVALAIWLKRHVKPDRIWHLVWLVPLFLLLPMVEEHLHFLLFGGFGFFSMLLACFVDLTQYRNVLPAKQFVYCLVGHQVVSGHGNPFPFG
jgi:hypothetical protein